jgi:hypothetical protein
MRKRKQKPAMSNPQRAARRAGGKPAHCPTDLVTASSVPPVVVNRPGETISNRSQRAVVPIRERCWVSIDEARQMTGEGRTRIYELIALGKLLSKKVRRRRLVNVASLLDYCGE